MSIIWATYKKGALIFFCEALNGPFIIVILQIFRKTFGSLYGLLEIMDEDPLSLQEESLSVCDVKANRMATLSLQLPDTVIQAISTIPFSNNPEFKILQLGLFLIMAHSPLKLHTLWLKG